MKALATLCLVLLCCSTSRADEGVRVRKATAIIGSSVTVERGEARLGKVVDLVLNEGGCVDFLIVDCGDGLVAVPWGVVTYTVERRTVVIKYEITRERLREVTFARDRWPDFYEGRFTQRLRAAWGEKALRHGGKAGGDERRPDRDRKTGDEDRRPDRDGGRKDPPVTKDRDREPAKDKVEPAKDRPARDKDRPKEKPKDKPQNEPPRS